MQQIAPEAEIGRQYVDKLAKVWLKNGQEQWVLIHIEVQMDQDGKFPVRMYAYNCGLFLKYNKKVASFAVLGDDSPTWRPQGQRYELWGTEVAIRFPVLKLLDFAQRRAELEQSSNPFASVVLAHLDTQETRHDLGGRKDRKFRLAKLLLERGWDAERVRQLFRLIDWLMELPVDLKVEFSDEITHYTKEKHMPFVSVLDELVQEASFEKGMQRGLSQGREESRLEDIEAILEVRFPAASGQLMSEIRQVRDPEELKNILCGAATASDPEELRKLWSAESGNQSPRESKQFPRHQAALERTNKARPDAGLDELIAEIVDRGFWGL